MLGRMTLSKKYPLNGSPCDRLRVIGHVVTSSDRGECVLDVAEHPEERTGGVPAPTRKLRCESWTIVRS